MAVETRTWTMAAETFGREAAAAVTAAAAPASVESPRSRWLGRAPADQSPVPAARQWLAVSSRGYKDKVSVRMAKTKVWAHA